MKNFQKNQNFKKNRENEKIFAGQLKSPYRLLLNFWQKVPSAFGHRRPRHGVILLYFLSEIYPRG